MRLKVKCKFCYKVYEANFEDISKFETCSDECKYHYYNATGTGFVPFGIRNKIIRDISINISFSEVLYKYKRIRGLI